MATAAELHIGDAVLPFSDPAADVMTIYDFELGYSIALCNWVIGTQMFKGRFPVSSLVRVSRCSRRA